ncbi:MAG: sortase [Actinomycetota bacterium]|nr:sortase [Actinomycetota bacterium]
MTWLRNLGKFLIAVGVGVLLFVGWILWGTGLYTARQQNRLEDELAKLPAIEPQRDGNGDSAFAGPGDDYLPGEGQPVFGLRIPRIDLSNVVVQGVGVEELKLGPGHYPDCRDEFKGSLCTEQEEVWPGERGRVIISGHRTTYGQPFWSLDRVQEGDDIITETKWGTFVYEVTDIEIVSPQARDIVLPDPPGSRAEIALTTCNPRFSASQRLVVFGEMKKPA